MEGCHGDEKKQRASQARSSLDGESLRTPPRHGTPSPATEQPVLLSVKRPRSNLEVFPVPLTSLWQRNFPWLWTVKGGV
jgi:hypothetical protein